MVALLTLMRTLKGNKNFHVVKNAEFAKNIFNPISGGGGFGHFRPNFYYVESHGCQTFY